MSRLKTTSLALLAFTGMLHFSPARADVGTDTAKLLTMMYQDTRQDCGRTTRPAFLCSGVLLRATTPSTAYQFYSVSPASQARGGVSVSYLRQDAKFKSLVFNMNSGFVFDSVMENPADQQDYRVLCAFPIDGASDRRNGSGCGDYNLTSTVENACQQMGVTTAEQWITRYRQADPTYKQGSQCSFDVRQGAAHGTANAFQQNLRARNLLGSEGFAMNNELVLSPWAVDAPGSLPILAAFYTNSAGIAGARLSQIQWYQSTRQFLPAISIRLPQSQSQNASFRYEPAQQAIYPVTAADKCDRYVQSASWITRYDPGFRRDITTLSVVPTACGRGVQSDQTNNFFNEMIAGFYLSPEWINNSDNPATNIASMRRQLICHFTVARGKASFNLEPSRPLISQGETNAAGCNNV
ncbi:MAG TPA: DUF2599 domain-containing protein [Stenotrophomonas sp.]|jgi:hypothetical protein